MTFAEVLPALEAGKKARRKDWGPFVIAAPVRTNDACLLPWSDLLASDWELIEEPSDVNKLHGANVRLTAENAAQAATIARLERELADAKRGLFRQCRLKHPLSRAHVCTLPANHQGNHANSFGSWNP